MEGKKPKPKLMGPSIGNKDPILLLRNSEYGFAEEGFGGFVEGGDMETDDFKKFKKQKESKKDPTNDFSSTKED